MLVSARTEDSRREWCGYCNKRCYPVTITVAGHPEWGDTKVHTWACMQCVAILRDVLAVAPLTQEKAW